jgi:CRP-like cAMP-binding protein
VRSMVPALPTVATALLASAPEERLAAGSVLWRRGQALDTVTYLQAGSVAFGLLAADTATSTALEHHLGLQVEPGWVDVASAVLGQPTAMDATAETALVVRVVSKQDFGKTLVGADAACRQVLLDMAIAARQQAEWAVSRVAKDAEARCAEWLLRRSEPTALGAAIVQLAQRKRAIAAELGMAPETLSRVLRQLRERRLIAGSGRTVQLVDTRGLAMLANI